MSDLCKEIAQMGKGLSSENRYRILETIMNKPKTVGEIASKVKMAQPAVSQNLKVLRMANLVTAERQGQEIYYAINVAYMTSLLHKLAKDVNKN
jgi:DNA-binding transcriptional ArsR family regulator